MRLSHQVHSLTPSSDFMIFFFFSKQTHTGNAYKCRQLGGISVYIQFHRNIGGAPYICIFGRLPQRVIAYFMMVILKLKETKKHKKIKSYSN